MFLAFLALSEVCRRSRVCEAARSLGAVSRVCEAARSLGAVSRVCEAARSLGLYELEVERARRGIPAGVARRRRSRRSQSYVHIARIHSDWLTEPSVRLG